MIKALAGRVGLSPAAMRPIVSLTLLTLGVVVITANLAMGGGLLAVDLWFANLDYRISFPAPMPFADWSDRIGQRAVCLPLLFLLTFVIWRRYGFKRPIVIAVLGNLGLNFVVGVLKLATSRESPRSGIPEFFVGNVLYPSGHSGNVVFVYGLMAAFALRYALVHPRRRSVLATGVTGLTVLMFIISLYRETHWLTDLVVGALLGGIALECALIIDRQWPWIRSLAERMFGGITRRGGARRAGATSAAVGAEQLAQPTRPGQRGVPEELDAVAPAEFPGESPAQSPAGAPGGSPSPGHRRAEPEAVPDGRPAPWPAAEPGRHSS